MNTILFEKTYTRDNTLIIQQLWFNAYTVGLQKAFGFHFPSPLIGVDYMLRGAVEVWENKQARSSIE